jgi:hypothetical protein
MCIDTMREHGTGNDDRAAINPLIFFDFCFGMGALSVGHCTVCHQRGGKHINTYLPQRVCYAKAL